MYPNHNPARPWESYKSKSLWVVELIESVYTKRFNGLFKICRFVTSLGKQDIWLLFTAGALLWTMTGLSLCSTNQLVSPSLHTLTTCLQNFVHGAFCTFSAPTSCMIYVPMRQSTPWSWLSGGKANSFHMVLKWRAGRRPRSRIKGRSSSCSCLLEDAKLCTRNIHLCYMSASGPPSQSVLRCQVLSLTTDKHFQSKNKPMRALEGLAQTQPRAVPLVPTEELHPQTLVPPTFECRLQHCLWRIKCKSNKVNYHRGWWFGCSWQRWQESPGQLPEYTHY